MKKLILAGLICLGWAYLGMAQANVVNEASKLEEKGQFKQAAAMLKGAIDAKTYSGAALKSLRLEYDRLERIRAGLLHEQGGLLQ